MIIINNNINNNKSNNNNNNNNNNNDINNGNLNDQIDYNDLSISSEEFINYLFLNNSYLYMSQTEIIALLEYGLLNHRGN